MDALSPSTLSALAAVAAAAAAGVVLAVIVWRGGAHSRRVTTSPSGGRVRLPARAFERLALLALTLGIMSVVMVIEIDDALRHSTGLAASCLMAIAALGWLVRRGGFLALRPDDHERPTRDGQHG